MNDFEIREGPRGRDHGESERDMWSKVERERERISFGTQRRNGEMAKQKQQIKESPSKRNDKVDKIIVANVMDDKWNAMN